MWKIQQWLMCVGAYYLILEIPKEEYDLYKYFTKEELDETAKELVHMEKHLDEYKGYHDVHQMFEDIIGED